MLLQQSIILCLLNTHVTPIL